mmetsp:Transcript_16562/g.32111  ORF Transcript_16562/g.32111 Transcript_16562/m.32111 type:complete len:250 (+) Transcript_16562:464-1213(+)
MSTHLCSAAARFLSLLLCLTLVLVEHLLAKFKLFECLLLLNCRLVTLLCFVCSNHLLLHLANTFLSSCLTDTLTLLNLLQRQGLTNIQKLLFLATNLLLLKEHFLVNSFLASSFLLALCSLSFCSFVYSCLVLLHAAFVFLLFPNTSSFFLLVLHLILLEQFSCLLLLIAFGLHCSMLFAHDLFNDSLDISLVGFILFSGLLAIDLFALLHLPQEIIFALLDPFLTGCFFASSTLFLFLHKVEHSVVHL